MKKGVRDLSVLKALAGEHDKQRFLAIGESDRMTLKFIKPNDSVNNQK